MPGDTPQIAAGERCQIAVAEFMKDWNTLPSSECAWRMFHRIKTELARMEREDANAE